MQFDLLPEFSLVAQSYHLVFNLLGVRHHRFAGGSERSGPQQVLDRHRFYSAV